MKIFATLRARSKKATAVDFQCPPTHYLLGVYPFLGTDKILLSDLDNGLFVVAVVPEDCTPGEDCNGNGILDQCDVTVGTSGDCNGTLIPDECEIAAGTSEDCNANGIPDDCDIADGTSKDDNENGVPDECEGCEGDANGDGTVDPLDSGFVLARFGCDVGVGDPDCDAADQNADGEVNPLDSGFVLARFGDCP